MRPLLAILAVVHGLIHLMGPAKAFGYAELPQLTHPISKSVALLWLLAAALFFATATALYVWPRWWWVVGALAVASSQAVIITSWTDAKYGTLANGILLVGVVLGFLSWGPLSFHAEFDRAVESDLSRAAESPLITDIDLAYLPVVVQKYLRTAGVVVRAFFTNAGHAIGAELSFNEAGELTNFWSDDRLRSSSDGQAFTRTRWSTPVADYRAFGPHRVSVHGEARWHPPDGEFAYGRFEVEQIQYNVRRR